MLSISIQSNVCNSFSGLWKGLVPPNIEILYWMVILDKINTKVLVRIGILNARDVICPFCFFFEKLMYHALIHYHNIWRI